MKETDKIAMGSILTTGLMAPKKESGWESDVNTTEFEKYVRYYLSGPEHVFPEFLVHTVRVNVANPSFGAPTEFKEKYEHKDAMLKILQAKYIAEDKHSGWDPTRRDPTPRDLMDMILTTGPPYLISAARERYRSLYEGQEELLAKILAGDYVDIIGRHSHGMDILPQIRFAGVKNNLTGTPYKSCDCCPGGHLSIMDLKLDTDKTADLVRQYVLEKMSKVIADNKAEGGQK